MGALAPITINESSGGTIAIPASSAPRQALLRVVGANVWVNFNEAAEVGKGIELKDGEVARFWGDRDNAAVYLVTDTGESATGYAVIGYSNMEIQPGGESSVGTRVQIVDASGNAINSDNPLAVREYSFIDSNNSSTTPLAADAVFLGDMTEITQFGVMTIAVYSDVASATDGLAIEQSIDGTNWDHVDNFTIPAATGKTFSVQPTAKYLRIRYANGGTDQAVFRLQTILHTDYVKPSSHRIQDSIIDDDDAELVKAVLTGKNPADTFVNFQATTAGNFKVSLEELESGISDDTNSKLKVSPYCIDEYGDVARLLGDNIFQGALITIPPEHHEIHCGDSYESFYGIDLGNGATIDILIVVPDEPGTGQDQKLYHMKGIVDVESEATIALYRGTTVSANGTAIPVYNRNHNSANTDYLGIYHTPTVTNVGTVINGPRQVGSGRALGAEVARADEYVLENNQIYLLRITNKVTTANYINIDLNYYVHPGI